MNIHKITLLPQAEIEIGDGLPDIRLTGKCLEALKQAGFEVGRKFSFFMKYTEEILALIFCFFFSL